MKLEDQIDGSLVVAYDSRSLTRLMLVLMTLFLGVAGYDVFIGIRGMDRLPGLLGAAGTCLGIGILFLESARFHFVAATRTVTWRRRWALRERSGSLPFSSIQSVRAERPLGDDGTPSRRILLRTNDGKEIPVTVGYQPDPDGTVLQIAARIRLLLGHNSEMTQPEELKLLIATGRKIEAVRVLRENEGLSLTEAKQRVDELTRKASAR
jgi:hypothetical protein